MIYHYVQRGEKLQVYLTPCPLSTVRNPSEPKSGVRAKQVSLGGCFVERGEKLDVVRFDKQGRIRERARA
jgi:hypothetical protein